MNRRRVGLALCLFALAASGCVPEYSRYRYRDRPPVRDSLALMTTQDVIALSKARIGDNVIISMIRNSGSTFHLRTPDVIELADSGVSDTLISAMMRTDEPWGGGESPDRYYATYPPYYWWGASPWWSPWYFSSYWGDTGVDSIDLTITITSTLRITEVSVIVRTGEVVAGTGRWVVGAEIVRSSEFSSRILGLTGIAPAV